MALIRAWDPFSHHGVVAPVEAAAETDEQAPEQTRKSRRRRTGSGQ